MRYNRSINHFLPVLSTLFLILLGGADVAAQTDRSGPEVFRIGNAVAPINYWMTAWTLNDVFKMAGFGDEGQTVRPSEMWVPVFDGRWRMEGRFEVMTDDLGWPKSLRLQDGRRAEKLITIILGSERDHLFPEGIYRVSYEGTGVLEFEGAEVVRPPGPGEIHIRYDGTGRLFLAITETDPRGTGDYLRNIRILRPDAQEGDRFNARYLEYLRSFTVIRPLHMLGDHAAYGPALDWPKRKPENYSHWGGALGAPYEVVVDLANQSDSDLWLNLPIAADDAYVRELARLVLRELKRDRLLYIELGNEIWNWSHPYAAGRAHALEQARATWPKVLGKVRPYSDGDPVNESMMVYSWQGMRTVEVAKIFKEEWGTQADRIVTVLAGQIGASAPYWQPSRYLLESPVYVGEDGGTAAGRLVDAFTVAPYIHDPGGSHGFSRESPAAFIADAIEYTRGTDRWGEDSEEPGLRYQIRSDRAIAREFGLPLIAYEGGQHFTGSRFTRDTVNVHPKMAKLYEALFEVWQEEGGGLFMHFAGIIPRGQSEPGKEPTYFQSENFGIKERQTQTIAEAPKWRAVVEMMQKIGQCDPKLTPSAGSDK
jgi:hypothetical protein